ncbi:hypothetical protein M107_4059 [Bacteroides fragilis str. 3725 D9(v)]|nr:hypothetical protein M107_4059 [Bacteroides fragilis str. 3725 D9(v)]
MVIGIYWAVSFCCVEYILFLCANIFTCIFYLKDNYYICNNYKYNNFSYGGY